MAIRLLKGGDMEGELRPIGENTEYAKAQEKLAKFQREIDSIRQAIDAENAMWYARQSGAANEDSIEAADRLLDGQNLDGRDTAAKLRDMDKRLGVLRPAVFRQRELVDHLRGELSAEAGRLVQERHRKALAKILEAARQLAAAAAAERAIRTELIDAGYMLLENVTPAPRLAAPLILGDESSHDSPLSHYRRQLQELGIIK